MDEAKTSEPLNINVNAKADLQRTILDLETKLVKALRERDEDRAQLAEREAQCAEMRSCLWKVCELLWEHEENLHEMPSRKAIVGILQRSSSDKWSQLALQELQNRSNDTQVSDRPRSKETSIGSRKAISEDSPNNRIAEVETELFQGEESNSKITERSDQTEGRADTTKCRSGGKSAKTKEMPRVWEARNTSRTSSQLSIPVNSGMALLDLPWNEAQEILDEALCPDAGKGWVSPEEHGKALNEIEVIAGHAKDMEEELEQVQAEAAAAAAVVRKLTWVDTGTESGRTVFLCATCGCQRNEHHDPGCEILAVENGTAGKALLDELTRLRDYRRVMVELTLKEREEWKQALSELEKLRAVADAVKDVMVSRSVICFDSDQLSHIYVSVDGALLVKVREALDALEEKP